MGRKYDYYSATKTFSSNQTVTFSAGEIPSAGVVAYHLTFDDAAAAGTVNSDATRVRVKANGVLIVDMPGTMLFALNQRFGSGHPSYGDKALTNLSSAGAADLHQRFTIPLFDVCDPDKERRDMTQFPPGAGVTVEVAWGTVTASSTCTIGWSETDMPARAYPKFISQAMNVAINQTNARFSFADEGLIKAIGLNAKGCRRARLVLSGEQVLHLGGHLTDDANDINSMLLEVNQLDNRYGDTDTAATAQTGSTRIDPTWIEVLPRPAGSGRTFVELATWSGTSWAGAANEFAYFAQVPLGAG